jgi:hypothetical protein
MTLKTALSAAIVVLLFSTLPASSHDFWINHGNYTSPKGEHCCGDHDCFLVPASEMRATAAGWLIETLGEVVPYSEAQMSKDGEFWRCKRYDGSRRCFFAPEPTS